MSKEDVIIFGAGVSGKKLLGIINSIYSVLYFCDNDEGKWGELICGVKVISPSELYQYQQYSPVRIYIACKQYYLSIALQLRQMGINDYVVYSHMQNGYHNTILPKSEVKQDVDTLLGFLRVKNDEVIIDPEECDYHVYKDLSILIPTCNSDLTPCLFYLNRLLAYSCIDVIIIDRSDSEICKANSVLLEKYKNINIIHTVIQQKDFHKTLIEGLQIVRSKYCMILRDDDYIVLDNIGKAIKILNDNPDIGIVRGKPVYFSSRVYENNGIKYIDNDFDSIELWETQREYLSSNHANERVAYYSNNLLYDNYYGVIRTSETLKAMNVLVNHAYYSELDSFFQEFLFEYTYVLLNRSYIIDSIIYLRDFTPGYVYSKLMSHYTTSFIRQNVEIFKQAIYDICKSQSVCIHDDTITIITDNLLLYLSSHFKTWNELSERNNDLEA